MIANIDTAKNWFVVRTNIRCEAKASNNIRLAGFDVYWPRQRYEKWNKRNNTYLEMERSLMPRYLFVGFDPKAKHFGFVRACDGVERLLEVEGEPIPVAPGEVEAIFLAEVDMRFDDTRKARKYREESLDREFPVGSPVYLQKRIGYVVDILHGIVIGSNSRDKLHIALGNLTSWVSREDVNRAA